MCLEADECIPGLLECHGIPLLVPILFHWFVFTCSYLIGGTIPTSLLVLVETILFPLYIVRIVHNVKQNSPIQTDLERLATDIMISRGNEMCHKVHATDIDV